MPKAPVSQGRIHRLNMRLLSLLLIAALMLSVLIAVPVLNSSAEQDMATKSAEWVDKENGIAKITLGVNDPTTSGSGSTTATTKPTEATTTTTTSSSTVGSKLLIDWDKQKNYYAIGGTSTINSTDDNGINLTVTKKGRILGTYNNDTTGYDGITFTAKGNGILRAVVVSVEISVETSYTAVNESGTTFILDFANLGITPSETTEINFEVEGACELTISDIYLYSNTDNVAVAAVALSDDTSTAIVTYDFDNKIPTYSTIGSSVDSSSVYSATVVQYNSSNALKVNSNYWDGQYSDVFKAQDEYVKIDITETGIKSILFDAITVVDWYQYNGHYGVMIDGTIYWDNQYDNGLITRDANSTYTIESGTKLYSFTGSFSSAENVVEKTLTETDISNIQAIVFKTINHGDAQTIYVDNIKIVAEGGSSESSSSSSSSSSSASTSQSSTSKTTASTAVNEEAYKTGAVYTDIISDDFEIYSFNSGDNGWFEVYENGAITSEYTVKLADDGKTVTWQIPDITQDNQLIIYVKLTDENLSLTGTHTFKTNTSANVVTTAGNIISVNNPQPTLMRTVNLSVSEAVKNAEWVSVSEGSAVITLDASIPDQETETLTLASSDTTVILDRSYSMTFNNCYTAANEAAQSTFDAYNVSSYDLLNVEQKNAIFNAAAAKAGYQGNDYIINSDGTLLVDSYHGAYSEWCKCGEHAYILKLENDVSPIINRYLADDSATGFKVLIDSQSVAEQYLVDENNTMTIDIQSEAIFVNGVWMGYNSLNNQPVLIDVCAFKEWANENNICIDADAAHGSNTSFYRPYGHMGKNSDGKYEIITRYQEVKIKIGDSYVNVTNSNGTSLQVPLVGDYAKGCIDYLADAQDGLQKVVETVFAADGSRVGYMQFGDSNSVIYNNGKYYTTAESSLNDIVTYRNPESTSREAANLTYERIKNGAATLYSSGLNDAATSLVPNLASGGANKTQFVLFVSDGKPNSADDETYYKSQVETLVNQIKGTSGVEKVYFYTVGINLSEDDSLYLRKMAEIANRIEGVTGAYGDYIDVKSASDLGTQIKGEIIQQIATLSAYTDVISDDFEVDTARTDGWYEIYEDGVDVTSDYTGTISLGNDGKTVTWGIPDIAKSNELKIYIKLKDENMTKEGTNYFPTNDSAKLAVGDDIYTPDNEKPILKRTYGEPDVHKSAEWQSDYLSSGYADITLTAHDPYNNADVTTTVPSDTTVILDRSYSMTFNNCYTTANEAAQALFDTYGVSSYDALNAEQKNAIFNAAAAKAGYQGNTVTLKNGTTILDVGPGYGAYSEWCGCEEHAYIIKITDRVGETLKRYLNDTTTTGLKVLIDSKEKAEQYLVDKQDNYTIKIGNDSMFINDVWFGYAADTNNQGLLLDVHAFKEWAAANNEYIAADGNYGYNANFYRPYGHLGKNSEGKYEIITEFLNAQIKVGGSYVDVTNSDGSALQVPLVGDYAKGCIDYLADAQDGLQKVVETVFAADGSRVGYMQFGDSNSVIYNNGKYYTTAESSLNDIVTYRNPESTSREATNLTYERIKNGAATLYSSGLNDAATSLVPNLAVGSANKTQFVLFVSDGKPSDPDSVTYYRSQVETLVNKIKKIDGVEKVYFYTVGINLSEEDSIYLQKMAEFANSIDGVTGVYGDYIDVQNAADLGTEVGTKVSQVASGSAVYTDVLSEYFEFVEPLSYKLTIADDKNYTENASVVTQSSSVSYSADTLTWIIPEPTKYSKLTFTVKLKDSYMSSGVTNVPTNASAIFESADEVWSDSAEDENYLIEKPKLTYENASVAVDKSIEWISSDGIARVTATLAVRGSSGDASFTDSINTSVFEYYSGYAPASSVGDAPIVSNGVVSWSKSDMSYNDGIVTLTYYIKVKSLEQNGTLEDSAADKGPTFEFGDQICTETSGESTFSMTTLDIEYNKFSVTARVSDKNNTNLPTAYTIKGSGIEFAVNVNSNDVYTNTSSANAEVGAGTYTFNEYNGSTHMVSGENLTVTYDINYTDTNVLETENTSSYTATTLTTQVVKKGTANTTSATVTFINDYTVTSIGFEVVKKGTDGKSYGGAEFKLYEGTGDSKTLLTTLITAETTGIGTYSGTLSAGKTYTLIETKAPGGLELYGEEIVFTANASSSGSMITYNADTNKLTCTVTDTITAEVIEMPETGGYALYVIIAGIAMMLIAAIYLVVTKRRRNDDDEE